MDSTGRGCAIGRSRRPSSLRFAVQWTRPTLTSIRPTWTACHLTTSAAGMWTSKSTHFFFLLFLLADTHTHTHQSLPLKLNSSSSFLFVVCVRVSVCQQLPSHTIQKGKLFFIEATKFVHVSYRQICL